MAFFDYMTAFRTLGTRRIVFPGARQSRDYERTPEGIEYRIGCYPTAYAERTYGSGGSILTTPFDTLASVTAWGAWVTGLRLDVAQHVRACKGEMIVVRALPLVVVLPS